MDNAIVHGKIESSKEDCWPEVLARRSSSVRKLQISEFCRQTMFLQQISSLKKMIPKQIMSLEEKYVRHCLELIHRSAMRENSWPVSTKVNIFPDRFSSRAVGGDNALFFFSCGNGNVVVSSCVKDPIVGSITESTSMKNLLKSPLLLESQFSPSHDDNNGDPSSVEVRESWKPEDQIFRSEPMHKRLVSCSSTNSTFSDPSSSSSSSSSSTYCHGMLHCSWNNGFPHYVFSVEDQKKEIYSTNLSKIGSEYVYVFCSIAGNEVHDDESDIVGKMKVSTLFTLCNLGTEIMETHFILCAMGHQNEEEGMQLTLNQTVKKSKGLSKKVASIFKGNQFHNRQRTKSKFDGSVSLQDNILEKNDEGQESSFLSNYELAAIVVKEHIADSEKKVEVGGWGLKFLKEGRGQKQKNAGLELCRQNASHYSTSMDVVIPAGLHGGPRTKNGGPSSLVERWRNGGSCDCGGWDIGCPITLLNAGPNNKDVVYHAGVFGKSNSFELYTQGCKQSLPVIEVTNVHDGLYYIHYQSTLSALQSFSTAVAIIHSHSPTLKPKVYRN